MCVSLSLFFLRPLTWQIWDGAESGRCLQVISTHSGAVRDACWSPCGRRLLSGSFDTTATLTDVETGMHGTLGSLGVQLRWNAQKLGFIRFSCIQFTAQDVLLQERGILPCRFLCSFQLLIFRLIYIVMPFHQFR